MPSTEFFGYTITNVGPLTTTFTAPSSCSTGTEFYVLAPKEGWSTGQYGRPDCVVPTLGKCFASGEALDGISQSQSKFVGQGYLPYFSPGLHCPSGWTTAGTAGQGGNATATLNREGFFTDDHNKQTAAEFLPIPTIAVDVLAPSETLLWCCPSGHTANVYGACVSSVGQRSSFSYSKACALVFPAENVATVTSFDGSTWNPPLLTVERNTGVQLESITVDLMDEQHRDAVVVNSVPPVILVHQPTDISESGGSESNDDGDDSSRSDNSNGNKGGNDEDNEDAVPSLRASWSVAPVTAVAMAMLTGIGILAPW